MPGTSRSTPDYDALAGELVVPIHGRQWTIPPLGYKEELFLMAAFAEGDPEAQTRWDEMSTEDVDRLYLGPVLDEMLEAGVEGGAIRLAVRCANTRFMFGLDAAKTLWKTGELPPELLAAAAEPNRAARRQAAKTARGSTNTGAANTTGTRGSGRGTKSPRKS